LYDTRRVEAEVKPLLIMVLAAVVVLQTIPACRAADTGEVRPYFSIRAGAPYFTNPDSVPGIKLQNFSQYPFPSVALGTNLGKYWGVEIAADFAETVVEVPGVSDKIGEYAFWTVLGQLRLRYPVLNDRLVPYVVLGGGAGIPDFNDRNPNDAVPFGAGQDVSLIGAAGLGLEYFVADNMALGVQAKQTFGFDTKVVAAGRRGSLDLDHTYLSAGLRLYLDGISGAGGRDGRPPARAADSDALRGYIVLRGGGAVFTNPKTSSELEISSPSSAQFGAAVGLNLDKHWGIEVGGEYWEPALTAPGVGEVAEYALWTLLGQLRYRYPVLGGQLVPYAVAGGGIGFAEINDKKVPHGVFPLESDTTTTAVASLGVGIEYFLAENFAVGVEAKHVFLFENDAEIDGRKATLDSASVLLTAGIRVLFP
jgi:opacity protein-like surface antigen